MNIDNHLFLKMCAADASLVSQCIEDNPNDFSNQFLADVPAAPLTKIISKLSPQPALAALKSINSDKLDRVLASMLPSDLIRIFTQASNQELELIRAKILQKRKVELDEILNLPLDSAGALMEKDLIALSINDTVASATAKIRRAKRKIIDLYVVDIQHILIGRVAMENLLNEPGETFIKDFMAPITQSLSLFEKSEEIKTIFDKTKAFSIPVVGIRGELLGVVRYGQIVQAIENNAAQDIMAMTGVSREERGLSPPIHSVKSRLPWLFINLGTAFLAASIVGIFENTIAKVTALAVLMPVVAGQSGNTGAQAMAVTMRGLALKEIRTRNFLRLLFKELQVGFLNGAAIAIFTSLGVLLWNPDKLLAVLLGVSMISAMILASITGALIPLILTSLGRDPATSSSIILTTMTDVISFFSFLGLATIFISQLAT